MYLLRYNVLRYPIFCLNNANIQIFGKNRKRTHNDKVEVALFLILIKTAA